jgi:hypothetical protein
MERERENEEEEEEYKERYFMREKQKKFPVFRDS